MKIFSLILLTFSLTTHAAIEHPQKKAAKRNADLLKRVLKISSADASCTSTWYEKGIVVSAGHCGDILDDPSLKIQDIPTRVIARSKITKSASSSDELISAGTDFTVALVDTTPLAPLNLPDSKLAVIDPSATPLAPGTELLIAGYGETALGEDSDKVDTFGAAYVTTEAPTNRFGFEIQFSGDRKIHLFAGIPAGGTMANAQMGVELASGKHSSAMTLRGDSGGPSFSKNSDGEWVLTGIASAIGFSILEKDRIKYKVRYGRETAIMIGESPASKEVELGEFLEQASLSFQAIFSQLTHLDSAARLQEDFTIEQNTRGKIFGYQVSLANSSVNQIFLSKVEALEKRRDGK